MPAVSGTGALMVANGTPTLVAGNQTDCVLVNGSSAACGSGGGAKSYTFAGVCQAGVSNWPVNLPVANAPAYGTCDETQLTPVMVIPNNTSTYNFWVVLPVSSANPTLTLTIAGRSSDTAHATSITPSYTCVTTGPVDNPTFTALSPVTLTAGVANGRTSATTTTEPVTCGAGGRLYLKLTTDTTALANGATFEWVDFSVAH